MSALFFIVPLLVFVIVDTFASLNVALVVALIVAIGELVYSYSVTGGLDSFSVFSLFLLGLLAFLSYHKQSRKIFYLKPAILSFSTGLFLLVSYLLGYDVLLDMMERMRPMISEEQQIMLDSPEFQKIFQIAPFPLGVASILHGFLATFAALKMGRWGWFVLAGLGSFAFLIIGLLAAVLMAMTT